MALTNEITPAPHPRPHNPQAQHTQDAHAHQRETNLHRCEQGLRTYSGLRCGSADADCKREDKEGGERETRRADYAACDSCAAAEEECGAG